VRLTLIHNPAAGDGRPSGADLKKMLAEAGFQVRYESIKKDWKKALQRPADLVVAAGGDGTAAKVLKQLAGGSMPVALLPIGTANNIGRSLGIAGDLRELAADWRTAARRPFDVGRVRIADGGWRHFVEAVGDGPFALAIERGKEAIEDSSTLVGNEIDRALTYLRRVVEQVQPDRWQIDIDGHDYSGNYLGVEVMNIRLGGPGVALASGARTGDGRLDIVFIAAADRLQMLDYLTRRLGHHEIKLPPLEVVQGRSIRFTPPRGVLRVDDELVYGVGGEVEVQVVPGAVEILEPDGADSPLNRRQVRSAR